MSYDINTSSCQREQIAAYVDGELDSSLWSDLEEHIENCRSCASELRAQRLFLCELDSVLAGTSHHPVPNDFAKKVAAYAESDMSGVLDRREHLRALQFCLVMGIGACVMLGMAAGESTLARLSTVATKAISLTAFIGGIAYDTVASAAVVSRVVSKSFVVEARLPGMPLLLLILAVLMLSLLIAGFHRTRAIE